MSHRPALPPHLADDEEEKNLEQKGYKIWPQWPSKYGPGGRKAAKAKARSKRGKR